MDPSILGAHGPFARETKLSTEKLTLAAIRRLSDRGFVLHRPIGSWASTLVINDEAVVNHTGEDCQDALQFGML